MFGLCILACPTTSCARKGSGPSSFSNVFKSWLERTQHSIYTVSPSLLVHTWCSLNTGAQKKDRTILSFVCMMKFFFPLLCDEGSGKDAEMWDRVHYLLHLSLKRTLYMSPALFPDYVMCPWWLELVTSPWRLMWTSPESGPCTSSEHTNPSLFRYPYKARGQCYCYSWFF